jgi:antitoxin ParD1/3/4
MAMVKKNIIVTEQQAEWMRSQMQTGNYGTDSELIHEAWREKQAREAEIETIQAKLRTAKKSSFIDKGRDEILSAFCIPSALVGHNPLIA